jgi:glycosyltransferase involved in cell wall biosynthesis
MKRIYFDGLALIDGFFTGVGQYSLGILRGLDEIIDEAKYAGKEVPKVCVIIPRNTSHRFQSFHFKHIDYKIFPLPHRIMAALWRRRRLPPVDLWCGRGVYIFPNFVNMPLLFSKSALVVIDLSYELHREYSDEGNAIFLSKQVRKSLRSSEKIFTISENARREIVEFYKLKDVRVATPAVDPQLFYRRSVSEIEAAKTKYGIEGSYILALSSLEPRKNLDALVDVYCRLPKELRKDTPLLLVGVNGWKTEALLQKIIGYVEEGYNILRPSKYVADKDKPAIISGAKVLVYPSHYEGFGIPPLEALACGTPIITADNSSLPEVVGNVGKMVPSTDSDALYEAVVGYLRGNDKAVERARVAGPERAQLFSWKQSAQKFLDATKELSE